MCWALDKTPNFYYNKSNDLKTVIIFGRFRKGENAMIAEMLSYPFMVRAFLVGIPIALCAALLGVCLVLKRYSMIGDGLSHVGFGAMAIAAALGVSPVPFSVPVVVIAAFLLLRLRSGSRVGGDSAIALISTTALAVGVIVVSASGGVNTDVSSYMFGSILAVGKGDVLLCLLLAVLVLILFILFYTRIFAVTFDETFARATGVRVGIYDMMLAALTAVTVVLGMRMMGALLISALIIFPALTAMRVCRSFLGVMGVSAAVSVTGVICGIVLSYLFSLPPGGCIVCADLLFFGVFSLIGKIRSR